MNIWNFAQKRNEPSLGVTKEDYLPGFDERAAIYRSARNSQHVPSRVVEANPDILSPVYAGAASKTLLSMLSNKELKIALKNIQIEPITGYTVTSVDELYKQVKVIQRQGYCITTDELVLGAMCITAPVHRYILPVSLSIIGPTERLKPKANIFLEILQSSTSRISEKLAESYQST
jgi:DNA-binding IclR family transcriptional regulator